MADSQRHNAKPPMLGSSMSLNMYPTSPDPIPELYSVLLNVVITVSGVSLSISLRTSLVIARFRFFGLAERSRRLVRLVRLLVEGIDEDKVRGELHVCRRSGLEECRSGGGCGRRPQERRNEG
jgi:hypothetical protein